MDVLDRRLIFRLAPRSTPEMLESIPGVVVQKTNHGGGSPFIRGFTGQHVLYMIDGVRLNNSTVRYGPNQNLNTVDSFSIRRLELLRGPGSLLYGSDAIGGVIYVLTRNAPYIPGARLRWGGEALTRFSTADTSQIYNLGAWTQLHALTVFAGGSFKDFDTLSGGRGIGEQKWTGYTEGNYDGALTYHLSGNWAIKMAANGTRQYDVPRTDKCSYTDCRHYRKQFRDLAYLKLSGRAGRLLDRFDLVISYQRQRERRDRRRLDRDRIEYENDLVHTVGLAFVAGTNFGKYSNLSYGLDLYYDRIASAQRRESLSTGEDLATDPISFRGRFVDGSQYLQGGVFAADTISPWSWLRLRAGARLAFAYTEIPPDPLAATYGLTQERISDTALGFAGGLSVTFIPTRKLRLIAGVQRSFRAPNLDDYSHVGSEGGGFDVPSPDLSPEKATTFELGVKWACRLLSLSAFGHYTMLQDFIARQFTGYEVDGEPATQRVNTARGYVAGLEGKLTVRLPRRFYLSGWISWTRGDLRMEMYTPPTQPMRRMSPLQGMVAAGYRRHRYWAEVAVRWSARQDRLSPGDLADKRICPNGPDNCTGTPGWAMVSLSGGVRMGRYTDLTLRIENVSNEPYKYHGSGVYAPGVSAIALLRVHK